MNNTYNQYDQFEVLSSANVKNKYLFDFSHSAQNENSNYSSLWMVRNKVNRTTNMSTVAGDNAFRPVVFGNPTSTNAYGPLYTGIPLVGTMLVGAPFNTTMQYEIDNGPERNVPLMREDTLVFLGGLDYDGLATSYRSGYIELSLKTNKQNCIVGYGSAIMDMSPVINTSTVTLDKNFESSEIGNIGNKYYTADTVLANINELTVNIKNGKLNITYLDKYGTNSRSFEFTSNKTIADNQWHHMVINFTRPGVALDNDTVSKEKSIEFWIDGKLDKRTVDFINDEQVFFPEVTWLGANPKKLFNEQFDQRFYQGFNSQDDNLVASNQKITTVFNGSWRDEAVVDAFNGVVRTFAHGINFPLNKFEIQERYKFWKYDELPFRDSLIASAQLPTPTVMVNKKRALKLYWNNIPLKDGIELDDNFIVESYSVTHKNKNSVTETYNLDLAKRKAFTSIEDVRVAVLDNVLTWSPGNISPQNYLPTALNTNRTGTVQGDANHISQYSGFDGSLLGMTFSGVELNNGDRILLTNQINNRENGIWVFNGLQSPMTRANDADSANKISNAVVYVKEGSYADTYWSLESNINSFKDKQKWVKLESKPDTTIYSQPLFTGRWTDSVGLNRFISLQSDVNIGNYDLIVFMNYPEDLTQIKETFPNEDITKLYKDFIASLKQTVVSGASLYVSSPMLAIDLGIVNHFHEIPQLLETSDAQSASLNPFQPGEPATKYFDTHRVNQYQLATPVAGLTNKDTYLLTDFINYIPDDAYEYEQYHAKYVRRSTGIQEGNTWFIPGLALTKFTENKNLPGVRDNYRGTKPMLAPETSMNIASGTVVTKFANNYYNGSTVTGNPYDDYAATIAVLPGQTLGGTAITGKVFVNVIEDGYTFSRLDYNKAHIQVLPQTDVNETTNTRLWQYSTNRLNRVSDRNNVKLLTEHGQTVPTVGGGGGFIQAASNASSGTIRTKSDSNNPDYESDYYPKLEEEIYSLQEIPVYSMTWLGLQWLAE
jgi:hypothetical protein